MSNIAMESSVYIFVFTPGSIKRDMFRAVGGTKLFSSKILQKDPISHARSVILVFVFAHPVL